MACSSQPSACIGSVRKRRLPAGCILSTQRQRQASDTDRTVCPLNRVRGRNSVNKQSLDDHLQGRSLVALLWLDTERRFPPGFEAAKATNGADST